MGTRIVKGWKRLTQITIDKLERFRLNFFIRFAKLKSTRVQTRFQSSYASM